MADIRGPRARGRRADAANERLMVAGGALSRFPFCPALAFQQTGDPRRRIPPVQRAQIADTLRARA